MVTVPTGEAIKAFEALGYTAELENQFGYMPYYLVVMNEDTEIDFIGDGIGHEEIRFDRLDAVEIRVALDGEADYSREEDLMTAESFEEILKISKEVLG